MQTAELTTIDDQDAAAVVDVLADAFHDYPVMRFVIGEGEGTYGWRLARLIGFFVTNRVLRQEPLLGIVDRDGLQAAALVSFPHRPASPPALDALRQELWRELGKETRQRYELCTAAWHPLAIAGPQVHLNMIGVRRSHQGRGLARVVLDHLHRLSEQTPDSQGVTLTTEYPANVPLYEHLGYRVVGHARIAPSLETWALIRPNPAGGDAAGKETATP